MLGPSAVILLEGEKKKKGPGQNVQKEVKFNKKNKKPHTKKTRHSVSLGGFTIKGLAGRGLGKLSRPSLIQF